MVQLNPFKWGNKKKKKEDLRIEKLKKTVASKGGGRSGSKRRQDAKRELDRPAKEKARKEREEKRKASREKVKVQTQARNKRRGSGARNRSDSTSKSSSKSTSTDKAAWLKKTRNSPAAKSGAFTADERWAIYQRSQKKKKK